MSESPLIEYIRDPSSFEAKDLPRVLCEVERLRAELWSALCAAAATARTTTAARSSDIEFLTVSEVATKLKVSRGHVYELVRRGHLRVVRTGRSVRVPTDALHDLHMIGSPGRSILKPGRRPGRGGD